jgi:hypothetical protein
MSQTPDFDQLPSIHSPEVVAQSKTDPVVKVLLFLVIVVVLCVCLVPFCVVIVLAAMGPVIGNVFSEIVNQLVTPTPTPGLIMGYLGLLV